MAGSWSNRPGCSHYSAHIGLASSGLQATSSRRSSEPATGAMGSCSGSCSSGADGPNSKGSPNVSRRSS